MYQEQFSYQFSPHIEVERREDNGHFVAKGHGFSVTHHDREEAINRVSDQIQRAFLEGTITPSA